MHFNLYTSIKTYSTFVSIQQNFDDRQNTFQNIYQIEYVLKYAIEKCMACMSLIFFFQFDFRITQNTNQSRKCLKSYRLS
jgi:hypothetical protein